MTDAPVLRAATVPDKPSLDGLEAKWSAVWEADRHLRVRPHVDPRPGVLDRHPAADGVRVAARRPRVLVHAHRPDRPVPADARQVGVLPDGLGRQRAAHRAPGAELLRRPLRPVGALRPRLHPAGEAGRQAAAARSRGATSSRCAKSSPPRTRRRSSSCGATSACPSTGRTSTARSATTPAPSPSAASCATSRVARRTRPRRPSLWDVTFQTAVAQAELEAREYPGHYHRVAFHRPDGTALHIETTRPELIPAVVALIAHPDDERYQPLFGTTVTSPLFGVEVPVLAHPAAEMDKGAGIAMCCTFGDLTDVHVVARAAAGDPRGGRPRRADPARDARVDRRTGPARRCTPSWPGRPRSRRARPWWRRCGSPATSRASRPPRSG